MSKKRYALVGTGGRAVMYIDAIAGEFAPYAELVGLCDISPTRMEFYNRRLAEQFKLPPVAMWRPEDFDRMIKETRSNVVIVTSMDCTHHEYIIRAMELGCDVICEKPMTIDQHKARAIFEAIRKTGRSLKVTFNYRYAPLVTKVRELLMDQVIGEPTAVDFSWLLDTYHGAEYFHRWHREKDKSGGLLVHKATHHFDLVNWWLASYPKTVFALGDLKFYGRRNAEVRGLKVTYDRYHGHPEAQDDPFAVLLEKDDILRGLFLEAETESDHSYIRDRNVFGDDITIEDTMAVMVRYRNGVVLNYSLLAYTPWEGFRVAITGTKGRIEVYEKQRAHILNGSPDKPSDSAQTPAPTPEPDQFLKVFPMFGVPYQVPIVQAAGGHGGGDPLLLQQLFLPNPPVDRFHRSASHVDGAASIMIGISANQSMATGLPVEVDQLLKITEAPRNDPTAVLAAVG